MTLAIFTTCRCTHIKFVLDFSFSNVRFTISEYRLFLTHERLGWQLAARKTLTGLYTVPSAIPTPRKVSHLPLREEISSRKGLSSYAAAARLGKGASPCWQHALHIPLPQALPATDSACHLDEAPDSSVLGPGGRRRGSDGHSPKRALVRHATRSAHYIRYFVD